MCVQHILWGIVDLMVFIQEIVYLLQKMGSCNKSLMNTTKPVGLITLFITSFFKLGNSFVKLFFEYDKKLRNYTWKDGMVAKSK